jgi:tetratricopeptide (TPR) repeat protein
MAPPTMNAPPPPRPPPGDACARALSLHQEGRWQEAEPLYQAVIAAEREHFGALYGLGILRCQQRRFDEGEGLLRRALRRHPGSPEVHYSLGTALQALGRPADALRCYERAVALRPDFAEALNNLGNMLQALGRYAEAATQYRRALAARPGFAGAHFNLGNALHALGQPAAAIAEYREALAAAPHYAEALNNLGNVLREMNRGEEAVAAYDAALAAAPANVDGHYNRGNALKELGRFAEARAAFGQALALDPRCAAAYHDLVDSCRIESGDPVTAAMEGLAAEAGALGEIDRALLHFALGKIYADLGRHDDAFAQWSRGAGLKRRHVDYDEAAEFRRFARIERVFTPALLRGLAGQGDPSSVPIFILGMPRSGTSLVEQILASHPLVLGAGESADLPAAAEAIGAGSGRAYPESVEILDAAGLRSFAADYSRRARARVGTGAAERITDKLPANFRYVGLIALAFPNVRIIHVRRDPVDTCLSCFSRCFVGGAQGYSYDLRELGRYYRRYQALMAEWRALLPAGRLLEIRYEDLVADLETQARRLVAECGLPWDDACLAFHQTQRVVRTASAAQVRQPLYRSAVGRWRAYERHLGPLLAALGADPA